MAKDPRLTLTADDLAIAIFACAHASNWCKKQGRSKWWRTERAKFDDLAKKVTAISDAKFPQPASDVE